MIVKLLTVTFPIAIFVGLVFTFGVCAGHCILLLLKDKSDRTSHYASGIVNVNDVIATG